MLRSSEIKPSFLSAVGLSGRAVCKREGECVESVRVVRVFVVRVAALNR